MGEHAMKALSIKQPWAEAILQGVKKVENRTWRPKYTLRGPVIVHAGGQFDRVGYDWLVDGEIARERVGRTAGPILWRGRLWKDDYRRSAFLGVMEITGFSAPCDSCQHGGLWRDPAQHGWLIGRVVRFAEPISGKGRLGLFEPPAEVAEVAAAVWARALAA